MNIMGSIFKKENVKFFWTKFFNLLENLKNSFESDGREWRTSFIYSNLVKNGIELIESLLIENGYLEYNENENYNITDNTIDYRTGITYKEYKNKKTLIIFKPATFLTFVGSWSTMDFVLPEDKKNILDNVFNNKNNIDGKHIKLILGWKIMMEGITIENIKDIHIMDVHYN